jgi:hypothetical protein
MLTSTEKEVRRLKVEINKWFFLARNDNLEKQMWGAIREGLKSGEGYSVRKREGIANLKVLSCWWAKRNRVKKLEYRINN